MRLLTVLLVAGELSDKGSALHCWLRCLIQPEATVDMMAEAVHSTSRVHSSVKLNVGKDCRVQLSIL